MQSRCMCNQSNELDGFLNLPNIGSWAFPTFDKQAQEKLVQLKKNWYTQLKKNWYTAQERLVQLNRLVCNYDYKKWRLRSECVCVIFIRVVLQLTDLDSTSVVHQSQGMCRHTFQH